MFEQLFSDSVTQIPLLCGYHLKYYLLHLILESLFIAQVTRCTLRAESSHYLLSGLVSQGGGCQEGSATCSRRTVKRQYSKSVWNTSNGAVRSWGRVFYVKYCVVKMENDGTCAQDAKFPFPHVYERSVRFPPISSSKAVSLTKFLPQPCGVVIYEPVNRFSVDPTTDLTLKSYYMELCWEPVSSRRIIYIFIFLEFATDNMNEILGWLLNCSICCFNIPFQESSLVRATMITSFSILYWWKM